MEAWDEAAEVDASGKTESGGDVLAQLLGAQGPVGVVRLDKSALVDLGVADFVAEAADVIAEGNVIHAMALERLEAGNLRDEVHDAILAAHQLAQAKRVVVE